MTPSREVGTPGAQLNDLSLRYYARMLRKRWRIAAIAVLVAVTGMGVFEYRRPTTFTAEVLVEKTNAPGVLVGINMGLARSSSEVLVSAVEVIRTRAVLGAVVDSAGLRLRLLDDELRTSDVFSSLRLDPTFLAGSYELTTDGDSLITVTDSEGRVVASGEVGMGAVVGAGLVLVLSDSSRVSARRLTLEVGSRDRAIDALKAHLELEPLSSTALIWIRYTGENAEYAALVANGVASSYQRLSASQGKNEAARRRDFLARRLETVEDSLRVAQDIVLAFQAERNTLNPVAEGQTLSALLFGSQNDLRDMLDNERTLGALIAGFERDEDDRTNLRQMMILSQDLVPAAGGLYQQLQGYQAQRSNLTASPTIGRAETDPQVQLLDSLISETKNEMKAIAEQTLGVMQDRRRTLQARVTELENQVGDAPEMNTAFGRLVRRVTAIQNMYDVLAEKYYEAQITEAVETGDVQVVDPATVPAGPDPQYAARNLLLAAVAGLLIGFGLIMGWEHFDTRVRTVEDAEALSGLATFARIPSHPPSFGENGAPGALITNPRLPISESFRMLGVNLRFVQSEMTRTIGITSAGPGEGKSFIAANLAITLSKEGRKVLLIDGDLRCPAIDRMFEISAEQGLSDVLAGQVGNVPLRETRFAGLTVLTAGTVAPNPTQLLGNDRLKSLLAEAVGRFDTVIVDTPPVLSTTDASLLAQALEGMLLVVRLGETEEAATSQCLDQLDRAGATLLGLVVNGIERGQAGSYYTSDYAPRVGSA